MSIDIPDLIDIDRSLLLDSIHLFMFKQIQFRRLALKSPPLGPKWGMWAKKNLGAHPILQSAVCWYGRIGCAPEFFRPPTPLGL